MEGNTATSELTTLCEPRQAMDSIPLKWQMPHVTSHPGSSPRCPDPCKPLPQETCCVLSVWRSTRFVTDYKIKLNWTCHLAPPQIVSHADNHIEFGFGQTNGPWSSLARVEHSLIAIFDDVSLRKGNSCTYFDLSQLLLVFNDDIVRHNNSSVHMQESNVACHSSRL